MKSHQQLQQGTDWVNELSNNVYLLYGHSKCDCTLLNLTVTDAKSRRIIEPMAVPGLYPLDSSTWLRLCGPCEALQYGQT